MVDVEAGTRTSMISLRHRKIQKEWSTTGDVSDKGLRQKNLSQHQKLVRKINRADQDEDEEEKEFKRLVMQQQMQSSQKTIKSMVKFIIILLGTTALLYIYLLFLNPSEGNASSLTKALGILFGMGNKRVVGRLPSSARIISSTSISTDKLSDYIFPSWSWPWSAPSPSSSSSQYLVPVNIEEPIRQILHRKLSIKASVGVDVELFDVRGMEGFLSGEHGRRCADVIVPIDSISSPSMVDYFNNYASTGLKDGQRAVWLWCMVYSGQAYGYVDLDERNDLQLTRNLIYDLSKTKLKNVFIDTHGDFSDVIEDRKFADNLQMKQMKQISVLFLPNQESKVAKGMLRYLSRDEQKYQNGDDFVQQMEEHMVKLVKLERNLWTPLRLECEKRKGIRPLIRVCSAKDSCCSLLMHE
mmetsp:Transcript_10285/g.15539  ORF Transcript_10285/g.15539 Transcript_10285/m.15539 type:complete len:412 (-) Transcript_10285:44-1279(-)